MEISYKLLYSLIFHRSILIVDWNIHHDDNVQKSFENTAEVLYVSLHRQDSNPSEGSVNFVGVGPGKGFTVNVPWNGVNFIMQIPLPAMQLNFNSYIVAVENGRCGIHCCFPPCHFAHRV